MTASRSNHRLNYKLESLLVLYRRAALASLMSFERVSELCDQVEAEAKRIGYVDRDGHLRAAHKFAADRMELVLKQQREGTDASNHYGRRRSGIDYRPFQRNAGEGYEQGRQEATARSLCGLNGLRNTV